MRRDRSQPVDTSPFANITDPELRKKLEQVASEHKTAETKIPPEVNQYPKFVFSRTTTEREIGASVRVRNALDEEPRGGTIVEKVGRAYWVEIYGEKLLVHEPDDSWE